MRSGIGRTAFGTAALAVGAVALAATAWGKGGGSGGGGGSTTVNTQGVVAFGVGVNDSTRGTYAMSPNGSGLLGLTAQIYPMDVSRGRTPVTVLLSGPAGNNGIYALRADGTGSQATLLSGLALDARFRLDGDAIAYQVVDAAASPVSRTIYVADAVRDVSGDVVGLANATGVYTTTNQIVGLDFSRDGAKIVFAMLHDLWTIRISDGQLTQLTNTSQIEQYPRWSPNDDRIAYHRKDSWGTGIASILTINAGTGAVQTVLSGGNAIYATYPVWSPDSVNLLALTKKNNSPLELYQMSSTGGTAVNVTSGTGLQENTPAWGW